MEKIKVIVIDPLESAKVMEIDADLTAYKKIVGGYIEAIYPFKDNVALVCNEEAKLIGLPPNRPVLDNNGNMVDLICGTFFIVGTGEEDFCSLTEDQIKHYMQLYREPQILIRKGNKFQMVRLPDICD